MVTFSSASFPLSCASIGLALQCSIGGIASGFKVTSIGARNFRFSMASNKVGHFIYALRDRVWPDFVCHFGLLKHPWNVPIVDPVMRNTPNLGGSAYKVVRTSLHFLEKSASKDASASKELAKFGFCMQHSNNLLSSFDEVSSQRGNPQDIHSDLVDSSRNNTNFELLQGGLIFGSLHIPVSSGRIANTSKKFLGKNRREQIWHNIPSLILEGILDLRQALYDEADIQKVYDLDDLPPSDFIFHALGKCTRCFGDGHAAINCHAKVCDAYHNFERACFCMRQEMGRSVRACMTCNSLAHLRDCCPGLLWCKRCNLPGHGAKSCASKNAPRFSWQQRKVER